MRKKSENESAVSTVDKAAPAGSLSVVASQANLARDERRAALRALAGRLAHQIRNPLAAIRAACSSLHEEIDDADQRETLQLTLNEIDRMLGFVQATVQTVPEQAEKPQAMALTEEIRDVVDIVSSGHAGGDTTVRFEATDEVCCILPRDRFRVSVYSLLDHLVGTAGVDHVTVRLDLTEGRILLQFEVTVSTSDTSALTTGMMSQSNWLQPVGLLVAERFARDIGGRLMRAEVGGATHTFTLDLPCEHA